MNATTKPPTGVARPLVLTPAVWQNTDGRRVTGFRGGFETDATGVHEVHGPAGWTGGEARASLRIAVTASAEERRGELPDAR